MATVDWVLLALLAVALIAGWRMGTINVIAYVGSFVIAYQVARGYSAQVTELVASWLPPLGTGSEASAQLKAILSLFFDPETATHRLLSLVVSIVIFILVCWLIRWFAKLVTGAFQHGFLGKINQTLGAVLGLGLMLAAIIIVGQIIAPMLDTMGAPGLGEAYAKSQQVWPLLQTLPSPF